MLRIITRNIVVLVLALSMGGCAWKSDLLKKTDEADTLNKNLTELQQKYSDLTKENEGLKEQLKKLGDDLANMTGERNRLAESKKGLEDTLKSTADSKNQKIGELSRKVSELEKDNDDLRANIANLQKAKEEAVKKTSKTYEDLLEKMKSEISKGEVTISELQGKLTVNMVDAILFDSGKAEVKPEGLQILQKVVDILKNVTDKAIRIEGHTDNVPIKGALTAKYPTNWELSAARAINVTRFLQQQGVDPNNLGAIAFAEFRPVADNSSKEGRAKNRRIEITLVHKDEVQK